LLLNCLVLSICIKQLLNLENPISKLSVAFLALSDIVIDNIDLFN
jgi:hypothetical protein